nr:coordinator of PRMT5 and differentiation stimulator isoform X2 [Pogona vitticeps]
MIFCKVVTLCARGEGCREVKENRVLAPAEKSCRGHAPHAKLRHTRRKVPFSARPPSCRNGPSSEHRRLHRSYRASCTFKAMIDGSAFIGLEETKVVKNMKIFDWSPEKDRTENVVEKVRGTFEAEFEDLDSDNKAWELDVRATPTDTTAAPQYEEENWDKELAESENDHPYGRF